MITFVKDRPGHDRRYTINCDKLKRELGWKKKYDFKKGLEVTINWYVKNQNWGHDIIAKKQELIKKMSWNGKVK